MHSHKKSTCACSTALQAPYRIMSGNAEVFDVTMSRTRIHISMTLKQASRTPQLLPHQTWVSQPVVPPCLFLKALKVSLEKWLHLETERHQSSFTTLRVKSGDQDLTFPSRSTSPVSCLEHIRILEISENRVSGKTGLQPYLKTGYPDIGILLHKSRKKFIFHEKALQF